MSPVPTRPDMGRSPVSQVHLVRASPYQVRGLAYPLMIGNPNSPNDVSKPGDEWHEQGPKRVPQPSILIENLIRLRNENAVW